MGARRTTVRDVASSGDAIRPGRGEPPANTDEILTEATDITAAPGTLTERAEELLALLQRVVPSDAGWIGLLPEGQAAHLPVAQVGYDRRIRGLLDSPTVLGDVELVGLHRSQRPLRAAIVLASPAGDLHGLSRRELEVLGLLVTGASNHQIAEFLVISARTAAAHVEHVRAKLAAPSRTAAAARAFRLGLFVPPSLLTEVHGTGRG